MALPESLLLTTARVGLTYKPWYGEELINLFTRVRLRLREADESRQNKYISNELKGKSYKAVFVELFPRSRDDNIISRRSTSGLVTWNHSLESGVVMALAL